VLGGHGVPSGKFFEVQGTVKADKSISVVRFYFAPLLPPPPVLLPPTLSVFPSHPLFLSSFAAQISINSLGDSFDLDSYNEAVKLLPAFKTIF